MGNLKDATNEYLKVPVNSKMPSRRYLDRSYHTSITGEITIERTCFWIEMIFECFMCKYQCVKILDVEKFCWWQDTCVNRDFQCAELCGDGTGVA